MNEDAEQPKKVENSIKKGSKDSSPKRDEYGNLTVGLRETCERGKEALDEASLGRKIQLANFYFHSRYGTIVVTGEDGLPAAQFCTTRKDRRGGEKTERFFIGIGSEGMTRGYSQYSENVAQRKRVVNEFEATLGTSALLKKVIEQAQEEGDKTQRKIDEENYEYFPAVTSSGAVVREINKDTKVIEADKITVDTLGKLFAIISEVIDTKLGARLDKRDILAFQFFDAMNYADSDGTQVDFVMPRFGLSIQVVTKNNSKAFRSVRGAAGGIDILKRDYPDLTTEEVAAKMAEEVAQIAIDMDRAQGVSIVGSECPVILGGQATGVLVHEVFGHPCEADIICENRRNKSSTISLKGRIGSQVSDNVNFTLIDSGSSDIDLGNGKILTKAWGAITYDDRGQVPKRTILVDKGIQTNVLSSEETLYEVTDGLKEDIVKGITEHGLSGNVRREKYDEVPQVRMTNTYAIPDINGPKTPAEMASMIPKNKKGLYVTVCNGGWVQTDSGDFCIEAGLAFLIENGIITDKPIKDVKIVGNISKFGGEIKAIGAPETVDRFVGYCLGKGTTIITKNGPKPIEEIIEGEEVLTHKGKYHKVLRSMSRNYSGPMVNLRSYFNDEPIRITPEHPIFVRDNKTGMIDWMDAGKFAAQATDHTNGKNYKRKQLFHSYAFPKEEIEVSEMDGLPITNDLMELVGWYLAEGWLGSEEKGMKFEFSAKNFNQSERIEELMKNVFGHSGEARMRKTKNGEKAVVGVYDTDKMPFFAQFGKYAWGKIIPNWIITLPVEKQKSFLRGYFRGDGYKTKRGSIGVDSTSYNMILGIRSMLHRIGVFPSLHREYVGENPEIMGKSIKTVHTLYGLEISGAALCRLAFVLGWDVAYLLENNLDAKFRFQRYGTAFQDLTTYYTVPIKEYVEEVVENETVYNLEVEEDNSYVTDVFTVHNCGKNSQWVPVEGGGPIVYIENAKVGGGGSSWHFDKILAEYIKQSDQFMDKRRDIIYIPEIEEISGAKDQSNLCMVAASLPIMEEANFITGIKDRSDFVRDGKELRQAKGVF